MSQRFRQTAAEAVSHAVAYVAAHYIEILIGAAVGMAASLFPNEVGVASPPVVLECPMHFEPPIRVHL